MTLPRPDTDRRALLGLGAALALSVLALGACSSGTAAAPGASTRGVATNSGSSTPGTPDASTSGSGSASSAVNTVVINVAQANDNITPAPSKVPVPLGSRVLLTVTSDVADRVHLHGYDIEKPVARGGSVTFDFIANQGGLFPVETHGTEKLLLQLQVS